MSLSKRHTECFLVRIHLVRITRTPQRKPETAWVDAVAIGERPRIRPSRSNVELLEVFLNLFPIDPLDLGEI